MRRLTPRIIMNETQYELVYTSFVAGFFNGKKEGEKRLLKDKLIKEIESKNAKGAFFIQNLHTKENWNYQTDVIIPSASLIKMFLLAESMRRVKEGRLDLHDTIEVQQGDVTAFSVLEFLDPRSYTVEELLRLMIVYSDNTATNVLMDFLGMGQINECIKTLGYRNSVLKRKMMDFQSAKEGRENLTSISEMADLMQRLYTGSLLGQPYDEQMLCIMKGQADECMMRVWLPDEITIARKSGELDCLDHEIAIVYGEKTEYLYCFFVWDAASNNDAREILAITSKIVYDYFEDNKK